MITAVLSWQEGAAGTSLSHTTPHTHRGCVPGWLSITPALSLALPQQHSQNPGLQGMLKVLWVQHIHLSPP